MSWVAAAVIGGAVIGGVASNSASKKAAKGQEKALEASSASTAQAEIDVKRLFGEAAEQQSGGFQGAIDFLSGSLPAQIQPFQQGNVAAQEQLSRGLQQQQNAIFGGPVDLSGFQARQIGQPQDFALNIPQAQAQAPSPVVGSGFRSQFTPNLHTSPNSPSLNIFDPAALASFNAGAFNPRNLRFEGGL